MHTSCGEGLNTNADSRLDVFSKKRTIVEGAYIFARVRDGERTKFVIGMATGVDGARVGVSGIIVNPVGLHNKVSQGKAGPRSEEILRDPTPESCVFALIYRIEHERFTAVLDVNPDIVVISPRDYAILDGWVRESLSELINEVLSLPAGTERDRARTRLRQKMDTLLDKNLSRNLYSVCRSLKILN